MNLSEQITSALIGDVKVRIFEECLPRIKQCLESLSVEEIWKRPNMNSNSIGNLVLHVCGNIRQYIQSGVGGHKDVRVRSTEFDAPETLPVSELIALMKTLEADVEVTLDNLKPEDLIDIKKVQGFEMSVCSILIHVTEHLSYHTGQIAFYTKALKDIDLKFYGDMNLDVRSDET